MKNWSLILSLWLSITFSCSKKQPELNRKFSTPISVKNGIIYSYSLNDFNSFMDIPNDSVYIIHFNSYFKNSSNQQEKELLKIEDENTHIIRVEMATEPLKNWCKTDFETIFIQEESYQWYKKIASNWDGLENLILIKTKDTAILHQDILTAESIKSKIKELNL